VRRLLDLIRLGVLVLFERLLGRISRPQVHAKFFLLIAHRPAPFGSGRLLPLLTLVRARLVFELEARGLVGLVRVHLPAIVAGWRRSVVAELLVLTHVDLP
jgi:hypothetical protein